MAEVKKIGEYSIKDETARQSISTLQNSLSTTNNNVTSVAGRVANLEKIKPLTTMSYDSTTETITFS